MPWCAIEVQLDRLEGDAQKRAKHILSCVGILLFRILGWIVGRAKSKCDKLEIAKMALLKNVRFSKKLNFLSGRFVVA